MTKQSLPGQSYNQITQSALSGYNRVRQIEEPRALRLHEFGVKGQRVYIGLGDGRYKEVALLPVTTPTTPTSTGGGGPVYGPHKLLGPDHSDTTTGTVARGDIPTGQGAAATWTRLAISVPAANVLNLLGTAFGDTEPAYKAVLDGTAPSTIPAGASATAGTSLVLSHRDHVHGSPATWPATACAWRLP